MGYTFLMSFNFFDAPKIQELLKKNNIESKVEQPYHFNVTAGWVDPFCNHNEVKVFVLEKDLQQAKKILSNNL